jgi:transposase
VLGASNYTYAEYTYAEARWTEGLADWIGPHVNALAAIAGTPIVEEASVAQSRQHGARLRQPQGHHDQPL